MFFDGESVRRCTSMYAGNAEIATLPEDRSCILVTSDQRAVESNTFANPDLLSGGAYCPNRDGDEVPKSQICFWCSMEASGLKISRRWTRHAGEARLPQNQWSAQWRKTPRKPDSNNECLLATADHAPFMGKAGET